MKSTLSLEQYVDGIKKQNRAILAKAITLIESSLKEHQLLARELIREILPLTGNAQRIGISGTPGVGKSTFIEHFGMKSIEQGHTLAVLAIDPTSQLTGGSILGDKTRMQKLSAHADAFIRPSSNGDSLGGVAAKTFEVMLLCDAFGFDRNFIESVGVGQSEIALSNICDFFILLMQPGSGDELQGIKRGILEVSDLVIVNKADGDNLPQAKIAKHDYENALSVLKAKSSWPPKVLLCSSLEKTGFEAIEETIQEYYSKYFQIDFRHKKIKVWLKEIMIQQFKTKILKSKKIEDQIDKIILSSEDMLTDIDRLYERLVHD